MNHSFWEWQWMGGRDGGTFFAPLERGDSGGQNGAKMAGNGCELSVFGLLVNGGILIHMHTEKKKRKKNSKTQNSP
jgi:hypothetical protein